MKYSCWWRKRLGVFFWRSAASRVWNVKTCKCVLAESLALLAEQWLGRGWNAAFRWNDKHKQWSTQVNSCIFPCDTAACEAFKWAAKRTPVQCVLDLFRSLFGVYLVLQIFCVNEHWFIYPVNFNETSSNHAKQQSIRIAHCCVVFKNSDAGINVTNKLEFSKFIWASALLLHCGARRRSSNAIN